MPREKALEFKVGLFVLAALVALLAFVFAISDFSIFSKGTTYKVLFSYANGLRKNSPVRLAGVDAGHVRDMVVFFDPDIMRVMVEVDFWVQDGVMIPEDSRFMVNQLGMMGEKYLEVFPGVSAKMISSDSVLTGEEPVLMENVLREISALGARVGVVLDTVNNGLLNEKNRTAFSDVLMNLAAMTGKINRGEGTLGRFLTDTSIFGNLSEMTEDLKNNPWKLFYRSREK